MPNILAPLWPRTAFGDGFALRQATRRAQDMEFRRRQLNAMRPPEAEAINAHDLDHQCQALELDRLLAPIRTERPSRAGQSLQDKAYRVATTHAYWLLPLKCPPVSKCLLLSDRRSPVASICEA
jgi:hypothetical protein